LNTENAGFETRKAAKNVFRLPVMGPVFDDNGIESRKLGGFQAALCDMSLEI
jgi:hypothetical protein